MMAPSREEIPQFHRLARNLHQGAPQLNTNPKGRAMSILKHIELTGESPESWARAGQAAVEAARETLRDLRHIEVTRLTARIEVDGSLTYQTTVKLAFHVERAGDDETLALQQVEEIISDEPLP
jgi:flavin-binding protein dodecin